MSQIPLSHAVAALILIGVCAQVVAEVARMLLLFLCTYVSAESPYFPLHCVLKGNKQVTFGVISSREKERGITQRCKTKLLLFIQPLTFYVTDLREPYPLSPFSFHPTTFPRLLSLSYQAPRTNPFIVRKQASEHQIFAATKKQPFSFVLFRMLKDEIFSCCVPITSASVVC